MPIKSLILGAGQEVGKSCVVVSMGGKSIMFDCGMHMGYSDHRRYPDFSLISKTGNFTQAIDCLIITHFHLDHIGALPYFTEVCGYEGPIYMTYPTKALAPLMLEDYRKIMVERRGEQEQFSVLQIHECLKKVTAVDLRQTVNVDLDLKLRAYYAGHVLGAAMFYVEVGESNVVYTGDYNTTADRHLGAAQIDRLQPDLLITESTYATTVRDSKHFREREFLKTVHDCILKGGKVLIPVFALGRAQELCILLDEYWERMNLEVPIYFSAGLTMQANVYYKLLIGWTNQKVKDSYVTRNTFDFKHVSSFERSQIDVPGPCVLFATPGMLSGGLSLEVFKHWAPVEKNMVVVPGYCVAGTVGHKLMSGKPTKINLDRRTQLDVRCQIYHLSFSAHTDAKGIMDLVKHVAPRHVILVHGEKPKMALLKNRIATELRIQCFDPANNETVEVPSEFFVKVKATTQFLASASNPTECKEDPITERLSQMRASEAVERSWRISTPTRGSLNFEGFVVIDDSREIKVIHPTQVSTELGVKQHKLSFSCYCPINLDFMDIESIQFQDSQQIVISYKEHNITPPVGAQEILPVESGKVEPSKKKYRMDLQRTLSLDLEREPVADDIDDALCGYPIDAVNATTISPGSSFKQCKENKKESENRIDLNINVVPELTGFNCAETAGKKVLCLGFSDVLHAVHLGLLESLGCSSLKVEDDCLICNSFRACICSDSMLNGHYIQTKHAVILACSWSYEDEKLANRTMNLMRNMKFKLE